MKLALAPHSKCFLISVSREMKYPLPFCTVSYSIKRKWARIKVLTQQSLLIRGFEAESFAGASVQNMLHSLYTGASNGFKVVDKGAAASAGSEKSARLRDTDGH